MFDFVRKLLFSGVSQLNVLIGTEEETSCLVHVQIEGSMVLVEMVKKRMEKRSRMGRGP